LTDTQVIKQLTFAKKDCSPNSSSKSILRKTLVMLLNKVTPHQTL
jgi:hypothetical protein